VQGGKLNEFLINRVHENQLDPCKRASTSVYVKEKVGSDTLHGTGSQRKTESMAAEWNSHPIF